MNNTPTRDEEDRAAGFTLLELLVFITIVGIAAAIAIPSIMRPSHRLGLTSTAREITAALRLTRSAAITRNTELALVIDADLRSYQSAAIGERRFPKEIEVLMKVADTERVSASRGGFRFFADGSSTGGELTLSSRGKRTKLCVHWLTGQPMESDRC
jgi:general secretion pathway protein H